MGHRRDVQGGDLWAGTSSGVGGGAESTGGSAGVWHSAGDGAEDVGLFDSSGLVKGYVHEVVIVGAVHNSEFVISLAPISSVQIP
jgi:hypothetical protein